MDPPTTWCYTLSLHDALPIWRRGQEVADGAARPRARRLAGRARRRRRGRRGDLLVGRHPELLPLRRRDRKSTRLNSSHQIISYAVFCLKKKNTTHTRLPCLRL